MDEAPTDALMSASNTDTSLSLTLKIGPLFDSRHERLPQVIARRLEVGDISGANQRAALKVSAD